MELIQKFIFVCLVYIFGINLLWKCSTPSWKFKTIWKTNILMILLNVHFILIHCIIAKKCNIIKKLIHLTYIDPNILYAWKFYNVWKTNLAFSYINFKLSTCLVLHILIFFCWCSKNSFIKIQAKIITYKVGCK
jgi:hypothetical protein